MERWRETEAASLRANPSTAWRARLRPDRFTVSTVVIAVLGTALVLECGSAHGVMLSPDSAHYIVAARNLLSGEDFLRFDGRPLSTWPPLYPLSLAAASLGTFDPVEVVGPLNAFIFGLTVFVVGGGGIWGAV